MRIAICDDENTYINLIEDYISRAKPKNVEFECDSFYSGEELIKAYKENREPPYDLLFLDMEMSGLNGIETAVKIRKYDTAAMIIFITCHSSYVYECFDANPLRFLVKPVEFEKFKQTIDLAYSRYINSNKVFNFISKRSKLRLYKNNIIYFESNKRKMIIHTFDQDYEIYSTVNEICDIVKNSSFGFPHNSFIVNMCHIKMVKPDSLVMCNGSEIPISKKNRKKFLDSYLVFTERNYR